MIRKLWPSSRLVQYLVLGTAAILVVHILIRVLILNSPERVESLFGGYWYPKVGAIWSQIWGQIPFSITELVVLFVILGILVALWAIIFTRIRVINIGWLILVGVVLSWIPFDTMWGYHYMRNGVSDRVVLGQNFDATRVQDRTYAVRRLMEQVHRANRAYVEHVRFDVGRSSWPYDEQDMVQDLGKRVGALAEDIQKFSIPSPQHVKTPVWLQFHVLRVAGFVSPVFLEAHIALNQTHLGFPFTVAHELAHIQGFADEGDCNFVAYLACIRSESPWARYAGEVFALRHLLSIAENDSELYEKVWGLIRHEIRYDIRRIQDTAADVWPIERHVWHVYDWYLRANNVPGGVHSYRRLASMIIGFGM